jgi:hypothetical protein
VVAEGTRGEGDSQFESGIESSTLRLKIQWRKFRSSLERFFERKTMKTTAIANQIEYLTDVQEADDSLNAMTTAAMMDRGTIEDSLLVWVSNVEFDDDGVSTGKAEADGTIREIVVKSIQSESNLEFQTELETESVPLRRQGECVGGSCDPVSA